MHTSAATRKSADLTFGQRMMVSEQTHGNCNRDDHSKSVQAPA